MAPAAGDNVGEAYPTAVFISTSLDTRLVTTVSGSDTVSHFKKKIMLEHLQCFPAIGNINIHSLKVKRRGEFYHLSDTMLVKTAFTTTKGDWFVFIDASSSEQDIHNQNLDKHKDGDPLALPWVTHTCSTSRHDNNVSLLIHSEPAPLANQMVSNVDGGLRKDAAQDLEDRSSADKQVVRNKMSFEKTTRDVSNENLPVKKKRKTQRVKSDVKASEDDIVLKYDDDQVKDQEVGISGENFLQRKSEDKDLTGVYTRNNDGEAVGREAIADVATVAEKNIQHGVSEKEKDDEPVQNTVTENEKEVKLHNINKDAIESSQQDVGSNGHDSRGDQADERKEDAKLSQKQGPEVKLPERKKKVKKSAKNKNETLVMHADDNNLLEEKVVVEQNEIKETTLIDDSTKNDEMLVKEMEVSDATKSYRTRVRVENMEESLKNKSKDDIVGSRKRKKDIEKTASRNDEFVVKQSGDVLTLANALDVDCVRDDGRIDVRVENIDDKSEKQNEKADGVKKNTRKKKTKKSASRNEDESMVKGVNGEIYGNEAELVSKKCQSLDHHDHMEDTSKKVTVSEVPKVNNEVCIKNDGSRESNFVDHFAPNEPNITASVENQKATKKPKKKTKDEIKNDDDIQPQEIISKTEGLVGKAKKKKKKSSLTGPQDRLSKLQSTEEVELESNKSQSVDHHDHMEDASKNVTGSEVLKVNNEVCITNAGSSEINFLDHFAPGHQPNKIPSMDNGKDTKKTKKKTKISSKIDNSKVATDPNIPDIGQRKTARMTKNIDSESSSSSKSFGRSVHHQKSNKQQSVVAPVKKILPVVNSLLKKPGNIFGGDDSDKSSADDNAAVNSNSSTRTPSRKLSSSEEESDSSIESRRNRSFAIKRKEGGGKYSRTSENKLKDVSMADLLRSSSRFKKAKFTASQVDDTENQPVDFVPESQPVD